MLNTTYLGWSYPSDNDDPYFDVIQGFFEQQDDCVFGLMNTACNVIIPADGVTWDRISNTLSWSGSFEIPLMSVGFSLFIPFGPDGQTPKVQVLEGQRLIVTVPRISSGQVTGQFSVATGGLSAQSGLLTVGFCRNSKFYANFPQVYF
jgi:hypothetical protein